MGAGLVQPLALREGKQAMVVNCEEVWREISNYIDGDVEVNFAAAMKEHFGTCKRCASLLAGMQNVIRLYRDERMFEVPAGFSHRLQKRLATSLSPEPSLRLRWSAWLIPVAAIALIAAGVTLTNTFSFHRPVRSILAVPGHDIPPDLQVVVSNGSRLFHRPGCRFIHDKFSERTLTAKEAQRQGYAPCPRCLRQYLKTQLMPRFNRQFAAAVDPNATARHDEDSEQQEPEVSLITRDR
jgi:hypothetical protein